MNKILFVLLFIGISVSTPLQADECMEGNCESGFGTGFTDEGKIFQGQWKDGVPHGKGKLQISRGKSVEGEWEHGNLVKEKMKIGK